MANGLERGALDKIQMELIISEYFDTSKIFGKIFVFAEKVNLFLSWCYAANSLFTSQTVIFLYAVRKGTRQTKLADSSGNLLKELQAWTRIGLAGTLFFFGKKKSFTRHNVPAFFAARVNLYKHPKRADARDEGTSEVEKEGNNIGKSGAKLLKRLRLFLASGSRQMVGCVPERNRSLV